MAGLPTEQRVHDRAHRTHSPARASLRVVEEEQAPPEPERRAPVNRRGPNRVVETKDVKTIVPRDWWRIGIVYALVLLVCGISTFSIPPIESFGSGILAIWISGAGWWVARAKDGVVGYRPLDVLIAWSVILAPMVCLGLSMGLWVSLDGLDWRWAVAGIVCTNAIGASLLTGRVPQQFAAWFAGWVPLALIEGSTISIAALVLGGICALAAARHQIAIVRALLEDDQKLKRVRNRALHILTDYEDTGLGWFWETDRRGQITYLSPQIIRILDREREEIMNRPFLELFDLANEREDGERTLSFHLSARSSFQEIGVRAAVGSEERWWSVSGRPAYDEFGNYQGFRGSGTDLTEKRRSEKQATRLARFDSLTGLANRHQMSQLLGKLLAAPMERQRECSVMLLDLDRFKHVNDTLGHPSGDELLKQVAQRLQRTLGDLGEVGRLGGDEFKILIPGRMERAELAHVANEIIHALSQPYTISGHRASIGTSVGIAIAPDDGKTSEDLIRNADLALYAAKDGGRGRYHFYSSELHSAAEERTKLEQDLRDAIAKGELDLFYQPFVDAKTETISGFEALLRWNHPKDGWMSPAKFIPVAEDTGLIMQIGEWAIRKACDDLARWPASIRCAVNVSPVQFANPQLPSVITNAIASSQIDPSRLELEITESVFLSDDINTDAMFSALKRIGVRLALDDFGTGYSSLGYLKKAPFDKIKIDQSFVRGATQAGSRNGAIITSITGLANSLGMDTTAEGVETMDELVLVRDLGCSHVQGYLYSKAIDGETASAMLEDGLRLNPVGPRAAREHRQKTLRQTMLEHEGQFYSARIRNLSRGGAMVEGLWNVPVGTRFRIALDAEKIVGATAMWSDENRMGLRFHERIDTSLLAPGG
ncbi:EAL domain-containing protein [Qipengyuania sp. JC766]|uniref:EAL domain-containing protein n=1 Tax=Qipengyuania sp. JC766 TaxID=3232139 RepID=UPI0034592084